MPSYAARRVRSFRDLTVWQKSLDLVEETYRLTKGVPRQELYGLTAQMRRAAISIPANIAEGSTRTTTKDLIRFLTIAKSSLSEVETYAELCLRLGYAEREDIQTLLGLMSEIGAMLARLAYNLAH